MPISPFRESIHSDWIGICLPLLPKNHKFGPSSLATITLGACFWLFNPDAAYINTSFAERQNLTMRMSMRRLPNLRASGVQLFMEQIPKQTETPPEKR
jgi:hypothetical protein